MINNNCQPSSRFIHKVLKSSPARPERTCLHCVGLLNMRTVVNNAEERGMLLFLSLLIFFVVSLLVLVMGTPWLRRYYLITCSAALLLLLYMMYVRTPVVPDTGGSPDETGSWIGFCLKIYPLLVLQTAPFTLLFFTAYTLLAKHLRTARKHG